MFENEFQSQISVGGGSRKAICVSGGDEPGHYERGLAEGRWWVDVVTSLLSGQRIRGQCDGEDRAFARPTIDGDGAAHQVEVFFYDAQPKTGARDAGGIRRPEEPFEKMLLFFGGNSDAGVGNDQMDGLFVKFKG